MFICIIEQHVTPFGTFAAADDDVRTWVVLRPCVLPFAPFAELHIKDPVMEVTIEEITWNRVNGCFEVIICDQVINESEDVKEVALKLLTPQGWQIACAVADLDKERDALVKKTLSELKSTILTAQNMPKQGGRIHI